jgi:regulator of protease activity HflC (stomatin/prohibitin superfamily)
MALHLGSGMHEAPHQRFHGWLVALATAVLAACAGCGGAVIQPGHRGLLFDPNQGGLQHEVLAPGYHRLAASARIEDFDVTYSTRREAMSAPTGEGLVVDARFAVIYRPIVSELYQLDTEIGPSYYDEVVGPELRSAAREVLGRHSYLDLVRQADKLEDEIESDTRRRIAGKHIELSSVTLENLQLPPEIVAAVRAREIADQNAQREKAEHERAVARAKDEAQEKWEKEKLELEHDVERRRLQREAEGAPSGSH